MRSRGLFLAFVAGLLALSWSATPQAQRVFQGVTLYGTLNSGSPGDTKLAADAAGRLYVSTDHPSRFSCLVANSTATILTALGGSCAATTGGQSLYITDIHASASAAATTTADQQLELKSGTGGSCGTGTAVVWNAFNAATAGVAVSMRTPIKVAANSELCWMDAVTGNKSFVVNGFIQ